MNLKFVERGTMLDMNEATYNFVSPKTYSGIFYELEKDNVFLVSSEELFDSFNELEKGKQIRITFFRGASLYIFYGILDSVIDDSDMKLTRIVATSGLEKKSRRLTPRLELVLPARLYTNDSGIKGELVLQGQTMDVSNEGICILANQELMDSNEKNYFVEFTLCKFDRFTLPVILLRIGNCPQSVQFKHDLAFIFDFKDIPDEKKRLITMMFKHRMEGYFLQKND